MSDSHPDPHKMRVPELEACGCQRCQDTLRMHSKIDELIESQSKTLEGLDRLERTIARQEAMARARPGRWARP